eukprot:15555-Chlamydomonas_euryale.AAC.1
MTCQAGPKAYQQNIHSKSGGGGEEIADRVSPPVPTSASTHLHPQARFHTLTLPTLPGLASPHTCFHTLTRPHASTP